MYAALERVELTPSYNIGILLLCPDEMLSPTYGLVTDLMSYGRYIKSSVLDSIVLKKYGVALLHRRNTITRAFIITCMG